MEVRPAMGRQCIIHCKTHFINSQTLVFYQYFQVIESGTIWYFTDTNMVFL